MAHRPALASWLIAAAIVTGAGDSSAQQVGLPLERFNPSFAGDRFFGVTSPYVAGHLVPHAAVVLDYAHMPLVVTLDDAAGDEQELGALVEHQLMLHIDATLPLWERVALNLDMPAAVAQAGDDVSAGGQSFTGASGADFGDLRIGLRGRLYGEARDPFQLGIGGYLWVPTGANDNGDFVSSGSVRGMPIVTVGGRVGRFVYSADLGSEIRESQAFASVMQGSSITWGAAAGALLLADETLQVGGELYGAAVVEELAGRSTNLELLASGKYRFLDDFVLSGAVGPGLTAGIGTPDVRALFGFAFSPLPAVDRDGDGIEDDDDACPDRRGPRSDDPRKNGCPLAAPPPPPPPTPPPPPPPDGDGDGIADSLDACPAQAGKPSDQPEANGCPDSDGDGFVDPLDACVETPGIANSEPTMRGCPDSDGDGVFDKLDDCPKEPGLPQAPPRNGCPKIVLQEKQIFLVPVEFDTGKATLRGESERVLAETAQVLRDNPEVTRLEVQGHTDNVGGRGINRALSQARADAVRKALIARGIDAARLTAKGYGPDKPIASNDDPDGRQKNRRVQLVILKRETKP